MLQQLGALGYLSRLVDLRVAHDPFGIEHVRGALVAAALLVEDAVGLADRAVGPVIRQQWKWNAAQLFGPALQARDRIGTDLEDFAVELLEFFVVRTEPVDLIRSPRGKGKRHERNHGRPTLEARERDLLIGVVRRE